MGEAELDGVCYRFASDLSLVCFERKVRCLADFLHECCVVHGVADIEIANHTLIAKYYATDTFKSRNLFATNQFRPSLQAVHHVSMCVWLLCTFGRRAQTRTQCLFHTGTISHLGAMEFATCSCPTCWGALTLRPQGVEMPQSSLI